MKCSGHRERSWLLSCAIAARHIAIAACLLAGWNANAPSADGDEHAPPAGLRVFYTGHSFHMFVPPRVEQIVKAAGIQGHQLVGTQGIGGSRVIQHWDLVDDKNKAKQALRTGNVDLFTMAAHLDVPDEGITRFTELGLEHNANLRLVVQASWFPFDLPSPEKRIRNNVERDDVAIDDLRTAIDDWRKKLEAQADELNQKYGRTAIVIVPVGDAVVKLRAMVVDGKYPSVQKQSELFTDPIGHAGPHVQMLAAYCNYAVMYGVDPSGLRLATGGIDDGSHAILQRLAWETVSQYSHSGLGAKVE